MINATITGNLGSDPERKGEGPVVINVASANGYGERKTTTWSRVALWGKQAESALTHLRKGSSVTVCGFMYIREWSADGKSGQVLEVDGTRWEFRGSKPESNNGRRALTSQEAYSGMVDDGMPF